MALRPVLQFPDKRLFRKAQPIEKITDEVRQLAQDMCEVMYDEPGIGLAATQVGILKRLFVFVPDGGEAVAVVNPEIVERSDEVETDDEGCLSLQGVTVPVERNAEVTLVGRDEHGEEVRYELRELGARVAQHELDHLDGVLMLDRTTPEARKDALALLRPKIVLA